MLTTPITEAQTAEMYRVWQEWHTRLRPNRLTGTALTAWFVQNYDTEESFEEKWLSVVRDNVLLNEHSREKLPPDTAPEPRVFRVTLPDAAEPVYVGIDQVTGEFHVEHNEALWDAIFVQRGLDTRDIGNPFLVWQYVLLTREWKLTIRRACAEDIPGLHRLLRQVLNVHHNGRPDLFKAGCTKYTDAELAELLADEQRPVFAAFDEEGAMLGYAFCVMEIYENDNIQTDRKTLYIDDICVDEAARGHHVGSSLYRHVLEYARAAGCYNVTLNVWECNPGAMAFYRALGMLPYKTGMETIL